MRTAAQWREWMAETRIMGEFIKAIDPMLDDMEELERKVVEQRHQLREQDQMLDYLEVQLARLVEKRDKQQGAKNE